MALYRQFTTQEELDWEYRPEVRIEDPDVFDKVIASRLALSAKVREALERKADIAYGPTLLEKVDIYPAKTPNAAIVIFIHGGYWFDGRLRKENYTWIAKGFHGHDVTTVIIDYQICPKVTVDEITRQCRAAVAWVYSNAASLGGDSDRIYVTGNSAGGHLTAMIAVTDWVGDYGLQPTS